MPEIKVKPGPGFHDCETRPRDAVHETDIAWLDAVIAAWEILEDLNGRHAGAEALNPHFFGDPDEAGDTPAPHREPRELWALLSRVVDWTDIGPPDATMMRDGRRWIGFLRFSEWFVDVVVLAEEPEGDCHLIQVLQIVPEGTGTAEIQRLTRLAGL